MFYGQTMSNISARENKQVLFFWSFCLPYLEGQLDPAWVNSVRLHYAGVPLKSLEE